MNKYSVSEMFHEGQLSAAAYAMTVATRRCRMRIKGERYNSTSGKLVLTLVGTKFDFCKYFIIRDLHELKQDLKNVMKMK